MGVLACSEWRGTHDPSKEARICQHARRSAARGLIACQVSCTSAGSPEITAREIPRAFRQYQLSAGRRRSQRETPTRLRDLSGESTPYRGRRTSVVRGFGASKFCKSPSIYGVSLRILLQFRHLENAMILQFAQSILHGREG